VRRKKGRGEGGRKKGREQSKKERNGKLKNFPNRKFLRISKRKYIELVQ
jgi:hypothetical protein